MKLFDLNKLVGDDEAMSTIVNKLTNTYVKYKGKWGYLTINQEFAYDDNEDYVPQSIEAQITTVTKGIQLLTPEQLSSVETDPIWPYAGYHDVRIPLSSDLGNAHITTSLSIHYSTHYTWKAGLPADLILMDGNMPCGNGHKMRCKMLDTLQVPNRSILEAVDHLEMLSDQGARGLVALNPDLAIRYVSCLFSHEPLRFVDKIKVIRNIYDDEEELGEFDPVSGKIKLNENGELMSELFEHWEVELL